MTRKIIQIDEDICIGCGLCASACQQSAIKIIDGKAKMVRDDYCDGLGNCLPVCPVNAISFSDQDIKNKHNTNKHIQSGCPGQQVHQFEKKPIGQLNNLKQVNQSALRQWPIQIKLVPSQAPYLEDAHLLVAADCTAYAYANFHQDYMRNKVTLIGCPKLDDVDYSDALTEVIKYNSIKSVTVIRMEVPCCGGIEYAVKQALMNSEKMIPWQVVTVSIDGKILED